MHTFAMYRPAIRGIVLLAAAAGCARAEPPLHAPDYETFSQTEAARFNRVAKTRTVVYTHLADYLVEQFDLATRPGIGIDLGGGPGDVIFELAARTKHIYWINADINTWYASYVNEGALARNIAHRIGFVFADACSLPFRDNYADLVISRGSYQFWGDLEDGLREIHRVLAPGGQAFVGRGLTPNMPEDEARKLFAQGLLGGPKYDPDADAERFRRIMNDMGLTDIDVIRHQPRDPDLNYGVWLRFRKE